MSDLIRGAGPPCSGCLPGSPFYLTWASFYTTWPSFNLSCAYFYLGSASFCLACAFFFITCVSFYITSAPFHLPSASFCLGCFFITQRERVMDQQPPTPALTLALPPYPAKALSLLKNRNSFQVPFFHPFVFEESARHKWHSLNDCPGRHKGAAEEERPRQVLQKSPSSMEH